MNTLEEQDLEKFIRDNKDEFDVYQPDPRHNQNFLRKLVKRFREVISIVPYLVKVGIATILIFILSFFVWKAYICPPLSRISFKYWKAEHDYKSQIDRTTRLANSYINNPEEKARFESRLQKFDETYKILKEQLRENPTSDNIANMLRFYNEKLLTLEEDAQNYRNNNTINK